MKTSILLILCMSLMCASCAKSEQGSPGETGAQGLPGVDTSSVSMVQFCPNQGAAVYASNIPEFGICVNNALYGLTIDSKGDYEIGELMNGAYVDYANNTSCNFTVSGCAVSQ